jgi:nucleoside-diphosphate-sugar epimerase
VETFAFQPSTSITEGMADFVNWYKNTYGK